MKMSIFKKAAAVLFGDAAAGDVLEGKTFQSSTAGAAATGTMPNRGAVIMTPGTSDQTIQQGYHNGTGKILSLGGDAAAGDVLEDVTFSSDVAGREVAGTMPDRGAVVITPGTANQTIQQGYHNGSGYVKGDLNLVAGNIKKDVEIFDVVGTMEPDSGPVGNAEVGDVLDGKTFESAVAGAGAVGTMTNRGAVIITPGTANQTIQQGYHNGSGYVKPIPSQVVNIQRGNFDTLQISGDVEYQDITISPIDLSKSILICNGAGLIHSDLTPTAGTNIAYLYDEETIRVLRTYYSSSKSNFLSFNWEIIELDNIKNVQRGIFSDSQGSSSTPKTITITAINLSKSILICCGTGIARRDDGGPYNMESRAYLKNSTTIEVPYAGSSGSVYYWRGFAWQVVEFN